MRNRKPEPLQSRMAEREQSRFIPLLALAYGTGLWLAMRTVAGLWPLWLVAVAAFLWLALRLGRKPLRYACLPLVAMAALFYAQGALQPVMPPEGAYSRITATVSGNPVLRSSGRIALTVCQVSLDGEAQPGKAYLTLSEDSGARVDDLFDGAAIEFSGKAYHPQCKQNQYDFDFRLWLLQNGIHYGLTGSRGLVVLNTKETAPWVDVAARIRNLCANRLDTLMGEQSALAMGMLLGEEDRMPEEQQLAFQKAGVMHLMSVSGLHVALLSGALMWLLKRLAIRKAIRIPVLAVLVVLYCGVTGFAAASVRATVMLLLLLVAQASGRKPEALTTLSAAALIVLIFKPLDLFSAGFVLSFSAMAGILFLYPRLARWLRADAEPKRANGLRGQIRRGLTRLLGRPGQILAVSLAAQAGVLLPTAEYYHWLPLYGVAFNLLAVPLAGLLVPLYALTLLTSLLPFVGVALGGLLGVLARGGSQLMLSLVGLSAYLPLAQVRVPAPSLWVYLTVALGVVLASRHIHAKPSRRALAFALIVLVAAGGAYGTRPAALRYHQMAVGQGDAALIFDGDRTVAIDVGPEGSEAAQRLLAEGRDVDALILTHLHSDHAQGVFTLISEGVLIRRAYLPAGALRTRPGEEGYDTLALLQANNVPLEELSAGDTLTFHDATLEVLWPQQGGLRERENVNDGSMATLIRLGTLRILSMGDVSGLYEPYIATDCDVLKVGHHGSASGTTAAFLAQTSPDFALLTCRANAPLPSNETLQRLADAGAKVFRTDETGEIILEKRAEGYRILTYKAGVMDGS